MSFSLDITEETKTLWREFLDKLTLSERVLPETVLSKQTTIQMFWQQSAYAVRLSQKYPEWLVSLVESVNSSDIEKIVNEESKLFLDVDDENEFKQQIRKLRHRCSLHICWNDLILQQEVFNILKQQSDLANHCMRFAVDWSRNKLLDRYGLPRNDQGDEVHPVSYTHLRAHET